MSRLREARAPGEPFGATPLLARLAELVTRGGLDDTAEVPVRLGFGLTRREVDVLRVLARGRSNAQIAAELFVSVNTVATLVARILRKLDVATRAAAVRSAGVRRCEQLGQSARVPGRRRFRAQPTGPR
jgi:DNA-binding NarL/FixJ family response regulator